MKKILVIEDSSTVRNILLQVIQKTLNVPTDAAESMAQCRELIKKNGKLKQKCNKNRRRKNV